MKRPAFTLIELMVVAAVFSVLFLVATGVYTSAFSRQKTVQAKQRVATEARSALETIARSVRVGNIDYAYYRTGCTGARCDLTQTQGIIAVRDTSNAQTCFRVSPPNDPKPNQLQTTTDCSQASPTWTTMTPDDLVVTGFTAYISPASDPFLGPPTKASDCRINPATATLGYTASGGVCRCASTSTDCWTGQVCDTTAGICKNPNTQPIVTISFTLSTLPLANYPASSKLQTSVVTRNYQR